MKIVIGIDPGRQHTGWAVIQAESTRKCSIISGGTITTAKEDPQSAMVTLHKEISNVVSQYKDIVCAIEKTLVNVNPKSSIQLCQFKGALMLTMSINGVPVYEYYPTAIKKSVTGNGKSDKLGIKKILQHMFPLSKFSSLHEVDAVAVGMCHVYHSHINGNNLC